MQKDSPLISVIIPVYNAEKTLNSTIESILNQSYSNIELILVNDGSVDNSFQICNEIANSDNRVKIYFQDNKGVSAARNLGLEKMSGDWVTFVDADDYVTPNGFQSLIERQRQTKVDLVFGNVVKLKGDKRILFYTSKEEVSYNPCGYLANIPKKLSSCGYLLRSSIVQDNHIRQIEGLKTNEDGLFLMTAASFCKSVAGVNTTVYEYIINDSSVTQVPNTQMHSYMAFWVSKLYYNLANDHINNHQKYIAISQIAYNKMKLGFLLAFKGKCNFKTFLRTRADFFKFYSYGVNADILYWIRALNSYFLIKRREFIKFHDENGKFKITFS